MNRDTDFANSGRTRFAPLFAVKRQQYEGRYIRTQPRSRFSAKRWFGFCRVPINFTRSRRLRTALLWRRKEGGLTLSPVSFQMSQRYTTYRRRCCCRDKIGGRISGDWWSNDGLSGGSCSFDLVEVGGPFHRPTKRCRYESTFALECVCCPRRQPEPGPISLFGSPGCKEWMRERGEFQEATLGVRQLSLSGKALSYGQKEEWQPQRGNREGEDGPRGSG